MRWAWVTAALLVATAATLGAIVDGESLADEAGRRFLDRHMETDGRVVRDRGDTVSEGQAYAMLTSLGLADREAFDRAWTWAQENLLQPEGHLAWHWENGAVTDSQSAPDADIDAAAALALAGRRFGDPSYLRDASNLAEAVMGQSTVQIAGSRYLAAGAWAVEDPVTVNPSYLDPRWFELLGDVTGDPGWRELAESARRSLDQVTAGPALPPDWAVLTTGGLQPIGSPIDPGGAPRWGFDAFRVPVRLASSCDPGDRSLASRMWGLIDGADVTGVATTAGEPMEGGPESVALVAAAAAAVAAGDTEAGERLMADADALSHGKYYADAWLALGRLFLHTDLRGCE